MYFSLVVASRATLERWPSTRVIALSCASKGRYSALSLVFVLIAINKFYQLLAIKEQNHTSEPEARKRVLKSGMIVTQNNSSLLLKSNIHSFTIGI